MFEFVVSKDQSTSTEHVKDKDDEIPSNDENKYDQYSNPLDSNILADECESMEISEHESEHESEQELEGILLTKNYV